MIESISGILTQGFYYIVPLIILLGMLIFIHELGHFLVARWCGVKVEVFSLGFGKKLFQFQRGDTVYCLSAIPFGGYVKMYGEDPRADIPEEQKRVSFSHKNVWQRIAVVLAGPLMNLFFAAFLFWALAQIGEKQPAAVVGQLTPASMADQLGFKLGDSILKVNDIEPRSFIEFRNYIESKELGTNFKVSLKNHASQEVRDIEFQSVLVNNPNIMSLDKQVPGIDGLDIVPQASSVGIIEQIAAQESPAYKAGLRTGHYIVSINGKEISRFYELETAIAAADTTQELKLQVQILSDKGEKESEYTASLSWPSNFVASNVTEKLKALGIENPELYASSISPDSASAKAGLEVGDRILSINNSSLNHWRDLTSMVQSYKEGDAAFDVLVRRGKEELVLKMTPSVLSFTNPITGKEEKSMKIGMGTAMAMAAPELSLFKARNFSESIDLGIGSTIEWTKNTVLSFVKLFQNEVSAKSIGGPIMIGQLASESFKMGLASFLKIMAIISINLFVLNLLPVPVLDGGHLLFYTIEVIRGAPLSLKKLEVAQQMGMVLLLGLMVFALFNDISRVIGG